MALKCAVELSIPTTIHRLGCAASLHDLITSLSLPEAKLPFLHRFMRLLSSSGIFSVAEESAESMAIYGLAPLSYLLVEGIATDGHINHTPFLLITTFARYIDLAMGLADWFRKDAKTAPFDHVHGASQFK
jgi:hypothetical protein